VKRPIESAKFRLNLWINQPDVWITSEGSAHASEGEALISSEYKGSNKDFPALIEITVCVGLCSGGSMQKTL
jgi:hypothetical protein